jgi:heat shock protein HtpX
MDFVGLIWLAVPLIVLGWGIAAYATGLGPSRSAVCVTRGLLKQLNREEIQGVVGHELGHIVNLDVRYAPVVAVVVGLVALVSDGVLRSIRYGAGRTLQPSARRPLNLPGVAALLALALFALAAPLFARLVQMAVSRQREFLADATSVRLTRQPHRPDLGSRKAERRSPALSRRQPSDPAHVHRQPAR